MRHFLLIVCTIALMWPSNALAAEPQQPSAAVPDLVAPVRFVVPWQCGPNSGSAALAPLPEPEINWFDSSSWFQWLGTQIYNCGTRPVLCVGLAALQWAFNAAGTVLNFAVIYPVNTAWRLLWSVLDWLQSSYLYLWDGIEALRLLA